MSESGSTSAGTDDEIDDPGRDPQGSTRRATFRRWPDQDSGQGDRRRRGGRRPGGQAEDDG